MHIFITPASISAVARDVYTLYEKAGYDTTTTKQVYKGGYMVKGSPRCLRGSYDWCPQQRFGLWGLGCCYMSQFRAWFGASSFQDCLRILGKVRIKAQIFSLSLSLNNNYLGTIVQDS